MSTPAPVGIADLSPLDRRRQQKAWNWYDWANSAYYTTSLSVLFGPYMITVAGRAAGCADADETCSRTVSVLGLDLAAGSLPSYLTSFATIAGAFVLPIVGALGRPVGRTRSATWPASPGRAPLRVAAVLHAGRQLAARRALRGGDEQRARRLRRWSATTRSCATSRPRRSATASRRAAGRSATSAAACCCSSTWSIVLLPRQLRPRHRDGRPGLAAVGRGVVGRVHDHPVRAAARPRAGRRRAGRGRRAAAAASASSPTPSATCGTTP